VRQNSEAAAIGLCYVIHVKQLGEREDCPETAIDIAPKRDNMLEQLLTILNTDNIPQPQVSLADDNTTP